jgi:TetR/AcrR family acrAB operon transcriptional repressor
MRRTQEEAEQTRKDLLSAGLKVFSQKGYQAARLSDIAAAAGVTRGAIYHHFGGKEELYFALMEEATTKGNAVMGEAIRQGGTFLEISSRIMALSFKYLEDNPEFAATVALSLSRPPEIARAIQMNTQESQANLDRIANMMKAGLESGALRTGLSPHNLARSFMSFQQGVMAIWLSDPKAFSIKEQAEALTDIFIYGIAPR